MRRGVGGWGGGGGGGHRWRASLDVLLTKSCTLFQLKVLPPVPRISIIQTTPLPVLLRANDLNTSPLRSRHFIYWLLQNGRRLGTFDLWLSWWERAAGECITQWWWLFELSFSLWLFRIHCCQRETERLRDSSTHGIIVYYVPWKSLLNRRHQLL